MPKFISKDGVWVPATKFTKMELEAQGLETLGQPVSDASVVTEAPIENEDILQDSEDDQVKSKLAKITKKRGIKSRRARVKS